MKKSEITVEALKSLGYKGFRHNPNKPISSTNITHETDSAIEDIVHAVHNGIKVTFNTSDIHRILELPYRISQTYTDSTNISKEQ